MPNSQANATDLNAIDALLDAAELAHGQGQLDQAQAIYQKVLQIDPQQFDALHLLGVIALQRQDFQQCVDLISQAIAIDSDYAPAHFWHGIALLALKQWERAAASLTKSLVQEPQNPEAHFNLGNAMLEWHRYNEAIASYNQTVALQPQHVLAFARRGNACQALQRYDEALASYDRALALKPDQFDVLTNRGNTLSDLKRLADAINSHERALKLAPTHATVLSNLGGALREAGRWDEALTHCDRALENEADHVGAHMNRGSVLLDTGRLGDAREAFAKVNTLQSNHADAQWGQGWCDLLAGDLERGLPQLEWRWKKASFTSPPRPFTQPLWLGEQDLQGRTILLHAEQGLGDTIQFSRYAPMLAQRGAKVILEVQPALKDLMGTLPGVAQVLSHGKEPLPRFDFHCPLMSLPLAVKTTLATIPAPSAYLSANKQLVDYWGARLGLKTTPRIGLVWSGNTAHRDDHNRSIALATVLSALPQGIQIYCLQKDIRASDQATLKAHPNVVHLHDALQSFEGTAALIDHMDVVISVDTSIAHLAGALGKPTWILLSKMPDWRWLLDRQDSPWYATAHLFRQTTWGQWHDPLQALAQTLKRELTH